MANKTLTRADIADAVSRKCGLRKSESLNIVDATLDTITNGLISDGIVKISGFATFKVRSKLARVGRNPRTREEKPISARQVVAFRPSRMTKDIIYAGYKSKVAEHT